MKHVRESKQRQNYAFKWSTTARGRGEGEAITLSVVRRFNALNLWFYNVNVYYERDIRIDKMVTRGDEYDHSETLSFSKNITSTLAQIIIINRW